MKKKSLSILAFGVFKKNSKKLACTVPEKKYQSIRIASYN
jgi:hypothetical protein